MLTKGNVQRGTTVKLEVFSIEKLLIQLESLEYAWMTCNSMAATIKIMNLPTMHLEVSDEMAERNSS